MKGTTFRVDVERLIDWQTLLQNSGALEGVLLFFSGGDSKISLSVGRETNGPRQFVTLSSRSDSLAKYPVVVLGETLLVGGSMLKGDVSIALRDQMPVRLSLESAKGVPDRWELVKLVTHLIPSNEVAEGVIEGTFAFLDELETAGRIVVRSEGGESNLRGFKGNLRGQIAESASALLEVIRCFEGSSEFGGLIAVAEPPRAYRDPQRPIEVSIQWEKRPRGNPLLRLDSLDAIPREWYDEFATQVREVEARLERNRAAEAR